MSDINPTVQERRDYAAKLAAQTVACRVRHAKFGVRRALTGEQIRDVADEFGADSKVVTAAKRILDTKDPAWRAVGKARARAHSLWKALTVPYPEPGVRLIRRENVDMFDGQMKAIKQQLREAATSLQNKYQELRTRARESMGTLFNEADYPERIDVEFDLYWDFPSIEPPAYLKNLHPHLYDQEVERIRGRFEEAVRLTEQAFVQKFHELVAHLGERLRGDVDGKPKVFKDSSIENLNQFFDEFRKLDIGSSSDLQALVDQAQNAVKGISPDELRDNMDVRSRVSDQLNSVMSQIDTMMIAKPTRKITFGETEPVAEPEQTKPTSTEAA